MCGWPLAPGASTSCISTHTITQADLNAGSITNKATASTTYNGSPVTSNESDGDGDGGRRSRSLLLVKSASPFTYDHVNQVISYSYVVTNSGNVSLAGPVTVTDDRATVSCPALSTVGNLDGFLDPGESVTCTASHSITQADLNSGSVTNLAQAHAGGTDSNTDTETVTAIQSPGLSLTKVASPLTYSLPGQVITYTYTITNSGNTTLAGPFSISDDKQGTISPCAGRGRWRRPRRRRVRRRTRSRRPTSTPARSRTWRRRRRERG